MQIFKELFDIACIPYKTIMCAPWISCIEVCNSKICITNLKVCTINYKYVKLSNLYVQAEHLLNDILSDSDIYVLDKPDLLSGVGK